MSFTPPPAGSAADPPIPNRRTDAQEAFDLKTDAYLNWQTTFRTWLANFVAWCVTMLSELGIALSTVENNKNAAQPAAVAPRPVPNVAVIAGATKWAAGNYAQGVAVWSPLSLLTYRRVPVGVTASATDLANDPAGCLTGSPHSMPQKDITTALDAVTGLPHLLSVGVHYLIKHPMADCSMPAGAVAQEMVRVTNQSGATTPILRKNGSTFNGYDDD